MEPGRPRHPGRRWEIAPSASRRDSGNLLRRGGAAARSAHGRLSIYRSPGVQPRPRAGVGVGRAFPCAVLTAPREVEPMKTFDEIEDEDDFENAANVATAGALASTTWVSVAVNLLLASTQVAVGIAAKSQALVADGIHSLADLVSDFIVLIAGHHSKKAADEDHPYGHHRYETKI